MGAVVVLEEGDEAERLSKGELLGVDSYAEMQCAHLLVLGTCQTFVKGSGGELMFLPRACEVAGVCGCRGVAYVLLGSGKGCRLHLRARQARSCRRRCSRDVWAY